MILLTNLATGRFLGHRKVGSKFHVSKIICFISKKGKTQFWNKLFYFLNKLFLFAVKAQFSFEIKINL